MSKKKDSSKKKRSTSKIKSHHAKAYRRRHIGLLFIALISSAILFFILTSNRIAKLDAEKEATELASKVIQKESSQDNRTTITSTEGFYLRYDPDQLYASAIESGSNKLFVSSELDSPRSYTTIKLSDAISIQPSSIESGSITFQYYLDSATKGQAGLIKLEDSVVSSINKGYARQRSNPTKLDGKDFQATVWSAKQSDGLGSTLSIELTTYSGFIKDKPMIIIISSDLATNPSLSAAISESLSSLKFGTPPENKQSSVNDQLQDAEAQTSQLSLFDRLTFTGSTDAASKIPTPSSSERISTLYSPAVVKIYNLYCMDLTKDGVIFVQNICKGSTGSGFMISGSGYIATNGHVAVNNPLDIAIENALKLYSEGDTTLFNDLVKESGLSEFDLIGAKNDKEKAAIILDKFYSIPKDRFKTSNSVENLLVGLGEDQPDIEEVISLTQDRKRYTERDSIKQARLVADDYRAFDGSITGKFKSSDVAIIKIEGSNFPSVKLGSISSLTQGSGLSVIGFPGAASTNELVESTQSRATLTSGKVSSIKSASGSKNQLIETDATIGHGNSGGPAFNDSGEVVGIATYTVDGSGEGNGVFNYVRDIADLNALASSNSIDVSGLSETQQEWERGVDFFYQARYSKAVNSFEKVKALYPQHTKVAQLTSLAEQKIAAGEELKDFPVRVLFGALILTVCIAVLAVVLILKHRAKHQEYLQQASVSEAISASTISGGSSQPAQAMSPQPTSEASAPSPQDTPPPSIYTQG